MIWAATLDIQQCGKQDQQTLRSACAYICTRSLIRAYTSRLNIQWRLATDWTSFGVSKIKRRLYMLAWVNTCQNATLLEITSCGSNIIRRLAQLFSYTMV